MSCKTKTIAREGHQIGEVTPVHTKIAHDMSGRTLLTTGVNSTIARHSGQTTMASTNMTITSTPIDDIPDIIDTLFPYFQIDKNSEWQGLTYQERLLMILDTSIFKEPHQQVTSNMSSIFDLICQGYYCPPLRERLAGLISMGRIRRVNFGIKLTK